ncbi:hypothetical protein D3C84_851180 [compost metagenome]
MPCSPATWLCHGSSGIASRVRCSSASPASGNRGMDSSAGNLSSSACGVRMSCHRSCARGTMCAPRAAASGLSTALMPCSVATICSKGALMASCSFCPLALNRRG